MLRKIEALRKQPKHVRNRYAFWIALCATGVIALVWSLSLPARFADESTAKVASDSGEVGTFKRTLQKIGALTVENLKQMRASIEYTKEDQGVSTTSVETIDLDALFASSTAQKAENEDIQQDTMSTTSTTSLEVASSTVR